MQITKNIIIKDATGKTVAFLSPKTDGLKDVYSDIRLNGESILEFSLPANSEKIDELTPECQIWADGRVYSLLKDDSIETVRDEKNKIWIKFMPVERWNELDSSYVEPSLSNDPSIPSPADLAVIIVGGGTNLSGGAYATGSAAHALHAILQGSGWTMGIVDVQGIHDLEAEKVSRLQNIKQIQEIWGGYLIWDSVNKVVHLRDEETWKNYSGFQVKYKKNLKHISRTQSNKLVTKLYCFGKDDLDIATVNGGIKYVTNNTYTPKEYVSIYRNPDINDAQELKEKAELELALICRPRYLYRVKMLDLRTLPEYSHEEYTLGDMVDIIDPDVAPNSPKHRLIRHRYNIFQPWDCELEIGDPERRIIEDLKASFNTTGFIDNTFDSSGKLSGQALVDGTVINAKIANAAIDATKFNTKQVILMDDLWGDNTPSTGFVAWNAHRLFFNGIEYPIATGNTNKKYIVWQKSINQGAYQFYTDAEFANIVLADTDFAIAVNNEGIHDVAWYNRLARQFIGSAFIADAAIKTAHIGEAQITSAKIHDLSANKIVVGAEQPLLDYIDDQTSAITVHQIILSNENQSIVTDSSGIVKALTTVMTNIDIYRGITKIAGTIGTPLLKNSIGNTIAFGTLAKVNPTATVSGSVTWTIPIDTNISSDSGWIEIPLTIEEKPYTKKLSWNKSKAGVIGVDGQPGGQGLPGSDGLPGQPGTNAKLVTVAPSHNAFVSESKGTDLTAYVYTPTTIALTPTFQNCVYSKWQYSLNGTTWIDVVSGSNGLTISGNVLSIASASALYTSIQTFIIFKCLSTTSEYDLLTVSRLYNPIKLAEDVGNSIKQSTQYNKVEINATDGMVVKNASNAIVTQNGYIDSDGNGTKDDYGYRVNHDDGSFSALVGKGIIRKNQYGESYYLNDIEIFAGTTLYQTEDGYEVIDLQPLTSRVPLPARFKNKNIKTFLSMAGYEIFPDDGAKNNNSGEYAAYAGIDTTLRVIGYSTTVASPYIDVEGYSFHTPWGGRGAYNLYGTISFILMVIAY